MTHLNTTSNLQEMDSQTLTRSFYPLNSLQTEPHETVGNNSKHPAKPISSSKGLGRTSSIGSLNVKRLADIIDSQESMTKLHMKGALSEAFHNASFCSPTNSTSQTKSIRQRISNVRPASTKCHMPQEESHSKKAIDFTEIPVDRFPRDSNSPPRDDSHCLWGKNKEKVQVANRSSQKSPSKDDPDPKMKQINTIYKNQSILEHLRKSNAKKNIYASAKPEAYSSITSQNSHLNQSTKIAWRSSSGFAAHGPVKTNIDNSSKVMEPAWHLSTGESQPIEKEMRLNKLRRNSSAQDISQGSFVHFNRTLPKKSRQHRHSGYYTNANNSANSSFHSYGKDFNCGSQNNISIEKPSMISGNLMVHSLGGGNNYVDVHRSTLIENKLEGLLLNKSAEPEHIEEINSVFDICVDLVCENANIQDSQIIRSTFQKIKQAYGVFFQNFSQNQNSKLVQEKENQQRLEKECEILDSKLKEMNAELFSLQKEHERLILQNKLPKNSLSPASSLGTINKDNQGDTDDNPPRTKNVNSNVLQGETFNSIIADQQNTINMMKRKEAKLVKLLFACKQRGLDIEQIYYEDVQNNGENYSEREEENIPTVNKISITNQNHPGFDLNHMPEGHYQHHHHSGEKYLEESDHIDSKSAADSDVYEKYSNYDHCEEQVPKSNIDPVLQEQLRLDFSHLNQPKQNFPMDFVIHEQKPKTDKVAPKIAIPKIQGLGLNLTCVKKEEDERKSVGFHEEFMSRMDEFSVSWRQAALKERKIP